MAPERDHKYKERDSRIKKRKVPKRSTQDPRNTRASQPRNVHLYNDGPIEIKRHNSLVISDWDDTLFPTSWISDNDIDLTDLKARYRYTRYFDALDRQLYSMIKKVRKHSDLMIVTNAAKQWVYVTLTVLPKTAQILQDVPIVSARDGFQHMTEIQNWKRLTFKAELEKKTHYKNIVSLGDAHYEHLALVDLYNWNIIPHKYLKSVKFIRSTDCIDLLNQIMLIGGEIPKIVGAQRHLDLTLEIL